MNNNGYEIERKFLIAYPDLSLLESRGERSEISQIYLERSPEGGSRRIRRRVFADKTVCYFTEKIKISDVKRIENEREISGEEFDALLLQRDENRSMIEKTRYCVESCGDVFEVDVYPFWNDRAIMEIEMTDESMEFTPPDFIRIIKEVTDDSRYTNSSLAKSVPYDDIT